MKYQFLSSKFVVNGTVYVPVSPAERTCDVIDCIYDPNYSDVIVSNVVSNKNIDMTVNNISQYSFYDNDYIERLTLANKGYVGDYAFYHCGLIRILNTTNKGNIGESAFYGCASLENATIANDGNIGGSAFYGLTNLKAATLGSNVTGIGAMAFYNCSSLPNISIPNSVISLGEAVFQNCSALTTVNIGKGVPSLPIRTFSGCSSLSSIIIPNNINYIGDYVFADCSKLADITFEDSEIVDQTPNAQSFPNWISSNHSDSTTSSEEYKFTVVAGDILSLDYTVDSESGYDFLTIKINGIEEVRESGHNKTGSYRKIFDNPGDVTLYMAYVKDSSSSSGTDKATVSNIWLNGNSNTDTDVITLGSNGSNPLFHDCPLDDLYIGRKLSYSINSDKGYSPFYRNTSLRTVEITDAETLIYDNEFYGCSNLKSLKIGNGVTSIGNWAFSGCSSLDYFSAGFHVETIGTEAFSDCTGLTKYYSYSIVPPVCGEQALDDINKWECTLFVPSQSSDEYSGAPQWKEFFFIEEMNAVLVAELKLNLSNVELNVNDSVQLSVEVLPSNATDKNVVWISSNNDIVTVDESGIVTAKAIGNAIITVKSADGNAEASCSIIVVEGAGIDSILIDCNSNVEVYNLNGILITRSIEGLLPGTYIIKQGSKTTKLLIH